MQNADADAVARHQLLANRLSHVISSIGLNLSAVAHSVDSVKQKVRAQGFFITTLSNGINLKKIRSRTDGATQFRLFRISPLTDGRIYRTFRKSEDSAIANLCFSFSKRNRYESTIRTCCFENHGLVFNLFNDPCYQHFRICVVMSFFDRSDGALAQKESSRIRKAQVP